MTAGRRLVGVALVVLVLGACAAPDPTGTATGIVVDVVGDLTTVTEFTISTGLRERMTFVPTPDGDYAFPLPHLQEHVRSGVPVVVDWERDGDVLWATAVDDAVGSEHA